MLEQVQPSSGDEHPANLAQRRVRVGQGAEGEGDQHRVTRGIVELDIPTVETYVGDRDLRLGDPRRSEARGDLGWLDRQHLRDRRGVVSHVGARTEADLEDSACQPLGGGSTEAIERGRPTRELDQPRYHGALVEAHSPSPS